MARRRARISIAVAIVAVLLGLPAVWRMRTTRQQPPGLADAGSDAGREDSGVAPAPLRANPSSAVGSGVQAADGGAGAPDGSDTGAWRNAPMAFGLRELGGMGPYVKAGLDAARRDMDFCFQQRGSDGGAEPGPRKAAVLLLHLEAREGAIDVVDALPESMGDAPPGLVECCRDVLRGYEIRAFNPVPGRRYRLRFVLE